MRALKMTSSRRMSGSRIRVLLLVFAALSGSVIAAYVILGLSGWVAATPTVVEAASLPGTASLSGTVDSTAAFKAAQVVIRNVDKRILYMVYTNAGQFRAVALFPGNYEISAATKGLESDVQKLVLKAGENAKVKLSLSGGNGDSQRTVINSLETENAANSSVRDEQSYDEIYPPGPGRDVAERTCLICHGENFLPSRPATAASLERAHRPHDGEDPFRPPCGFVRRGAPQLSRIGAAFLATGP